MLRAVMAEYVLYWREGGLNNKKRPGGGVATFQQSVSQRISKIVDWSLTTLLFMRETYSKSEVIYVDGFPRQIGIFIF